MNGKSWSRRQMLKGAGIALSLPMLETFLPDGAKARAANALSKQRYISMYFSCGVAQNYWKPTAGANGALQLSSMLEPLTPNVASVSVLGGVSNYSPWGGHVEPSHGNNCASAFTGVQANDGVTPIGVTNGLKGDTQVNSSISIDQAIAKQIAANMAAAGQAPLAKPSLQFGLSTLDSSPDGVPGQHSRSISWSDDKTPLYKDVSPQHAFDYMVGTGVSSSPGTTGPDPNAEKRRLLNKSALDYVLQSSTDLQKQLSVHDRAMLDQFMTSVRTIEKRVSDPTMPVMTAGCMLLPRPTQIFAVGNTPAGYDRGKHATLMIDLAVMAIQCDVTRVISFMLDDARSDYVYSFTTARNFTATGTTATAAPLGGYHGLQHTSDANTNWASCGWWNVFQLNDLVTKLSKISDGAGGTVLDNTVIEFLSGMNSGNHDAGNLPIVIAGGGGKVLKQGQYINFANSPSRVGGVPGAPAVAGTMPTVNLQDVHLTILQKVFGSPLTLFGKPQGNYATPTGHTLAELLA